MTVPTKNSWLYSLRYNWRLYRQAWQYVHSYSRYMWGAVALSVFLSVTSGFATYSFLPVFSLVFEGQHELPARNKASNTPREGPRLPWHSFTTQLGQRSNNLLQKVAGTGSVISRLARLAVFISALTAISTALTLAVDYLFILIQAAGSRHLREVVFKHLVSLPMSYFNKGRIGYLLSRVENDIGGTVSMVAKSLSDIILHSFMSVTFLALLFFINYQLALLLLPILLATGFFAALIGTWINRTRKRILQLHSETVAWLQEFLAGIRIIRAFAAERYEQQRWRKYLNRGYRLEVVGSLNKILPSRLTELFVVLFSAVIMLAGGWMITQQRATVAEFLVFFILLVRFQRPVSGLVHVWWHIQNGLAFSERIFSLLEEPAENIKGRRALPTRVETISFERVAFKYENELVLEDINFTLAAGKLVALVGPSGSGKSSIVDLLLRFYNPTSGLIRLNDLDISELPLRPYRALFGVVTQDTFLFHDTVRRNILYATDQRVSEKDWLAAARAARVDDFVKDLPQGYETMVGERGARFSSGQRQRIALARAMVRNPAVLVLDEATSALDSVSERQVQAAINDLIQRRTTLVIAHRLSTVRRADQILVLSEGHIVESGRHEELARRDGLYRHLWRLQTEAVAAI